MAKAKSSPKAEKQVKNAKPKGPKPDYTKKVVVTAAPVIELPAPVLSYYGISTAMIASLYDKKEMSIISYIDGQLCWQAAQHFVNQYNSKLHKLIGKVCGLVATASGNWQINQVEIDFLQGIVSKGIVSKRQRFWHHVGLILRGKVAPNLGFHFEDPNETDSIKRAYKFNHFVIYWSEIAQETISLGVDPESLAVINKEAEILDVAQPGSDVLSKNNPLHLLYQPLKFWAIDNRPAPVVEKTVPVKEKIKVKTGLPAHTNGLVFKKHEAIKEEPSLEQLATAFVVRDNALLTILQAGYDNKVSGQYKGKLAQ